MSEIINEIFRQFNQGNGEWHQFLKSIKITNIHGWGGQEMFFQYPVVAIVGANGIGKSTFLKAAVCAYSNSANTKGKDFYPSKMFMSTQWDEAGLENATIEYTVKLGNKDVNLRWKKTKDWGFTPKSQKPIRDVYFLDISRTLPLDATAGYAKIAVSSNTEVGNGIVLNENNINEMSYILGQAYTAARFTNTNVDQGREVGLVTREGREISQFHQGAGEDEILDMFKLLQEIKNESLLVIDEVENSLHPQAQRRFVRYLLKLAKKKKIQVILSTHSPYVLEELPAVARIMLARFSDKKEIIYGVSSRYALATIDDVEYPELYIHVEDEEAEVLLWEILKKDKDNFDMYKKKISMQIVGSFSVVKAINDFADKLPYNSLSIVDGDKRQESPSCLSLPGQLAPEKQVFLDMKKLEWNHLDERFGIGAGTLFKYLDDSILDPDHHNWSANVGDKIKKSKDYVWTIMVEEWCKQCLDVTEAQALIEAIKEKCIKMDKVSDTRKTGRI